MVTKFLAPFLLLFLITRCGPTEEVPENSDSKIPKTSYARVAIGTSGHSIELITGFMIEKQESASFEVYYFKPTDTTKTETEAGIYFGPRPDTSAPSTEYTKKIIPGTFMGNSVNWTEYVTSKYTQREVFVDATPDKKIHCWCYSNDPAVLEKLWEMVKTIK